MGRASAVQPQAVQQVAAPALGRVPLVAFSGQHDAQGAAAAPEDALVVAHQGAGVGRGRFRLGLAGMGKLEMEVRLSLVLVSGGFWMFSVRDLWSELAFVRAVRLTWLMLVCGLGDFEGLEHS